MILLLSAHLSSGVRKLRASGDDPAPNFDCCYSCR